MMNIKDGKLLYHLTKLSNLESIIKNGLLPRKILEDCDADFTDIANTEIMDIRKILGLDKYVPFHFHPHSSFDVAVKKTYVEPFVYICIRREFAQVHNFSILPLHPLTESDAVPLLDYNAGINAINWDEMQQSSTASKQNRLVRMAECLTTMVIPTEFFHSIAVGNTEIQAIVQAKLCQAKGKIPYVNIQPWANN